MPYKTDTVFQAAGEMFNVVSDSHNAQVDIFASQGLSREEAALASYIALKALLMSFETIAPTLVTPRSWVTVEKLARHMYASSKAPAKQPEATA